MTMMSLDARELYYNQDEERAEILNVLRVHQNRGCTGENFKTMSDAFVCGECSAELVKRQRELCVLCLQETPYFKDVNIEARQYYIETFGQLCEHCYYRQSDVAV